ncbi:MAG: stage II sporulation protein M [Verrucomicrobia bacterium]|nr:stage II sporulation protein M [Verrucomicrobiota bacterium]
MIINLARFITEERPHWTELEAMLSRLENDAGCRLSVDEVKRFHLLHERASADLAKIATFAAEPEVRRYLESLVARAYGEIHETRRRPHRLAPLRWFFRTFPRTFRRHAGAFGMAMAVTLGGAAFGGLALVADPEAKAALLPFEHLSGDPADRVAQEEAVQKDELSGKKTMFSAFLMTHNTRVSIAALALGMSWGIGTLILLFYNGVILGAVAVDYVMAGQAKFLAGWLLPHGAVEIPAVLLAGQAGFVLARAMIGWGTRDSLAARLRQVAPDLVTLIGGVAVLLVWAGFVEAFLSQYHEPVLPYEVKITFGVVELMLLALFLAKSGSRPDAAETEGAPR